MLRLNVFADEAGDLNFSNQHNNSRYFIVCTTTMEACDIGDDLLRLRRALAWEKHELGDYLHATEDTQEVRNRVFDIIVNREVQVQATIMEKCKASPEVTKSWVRFYTHGWYSHFFHGMQEIVADYPELHVTAASIGVKKKRPLFKQAISNSMRQTILGKVWSADVFPSGTDPCLQVADYCAWAIQRKWERNDTRSYDLIKGRITQELDLWADSTRCYY